MAIPQSEKELAPREELKQKFPDESVTFDVPGVGSVYYDDTAGAFRSTDATTGNKIVLYTRTPDPSANVSIGWFQAGPVEQSALSAYNAYNTRLANPNATVTLKDPTGSTYTQDAQGNIQTTDYKPTYGLSDQQAASPSQTQAVQQAVGQGKILPSASQLQTTSPQASQGTGNSPTAASGTATGTPAGQQQPAMSQQQIDAAYAASGLHEMAVQAGLSADQEKALQAVYNATIANDQAKAEQIKAAMDAATQYSDPYFKAQTALVTDSLTRALSSQEGDLAFREQQLTSALDALSKNIAASKDYLSFQHEQELKDLARKYEINLSQTQDQMAATGFTQSSRRSKTEQYLSDVNSGAVESSNRALAYQTGNLDRQLAGQSTDTQAQIANLQRLAEQGRLDLLRQAEQKIGSQGLQTLGYGGNDVLGNIGGEIPRQQAQDALSFANSYVF